MRGICYLYGTSNRKVMTNVTEIWQSIAGYDGLYEVSNLGRVRSKERTIRQKNGRVRHFPEVVLKPIKIKSGYFGINLYSNGVIKQHKLHRVVAAAFIGVSDLPIHHKDHNKANNSADNLCYVTNAENTAFYYNEIRGGKSSKFTGVYYSKNRKKWAAEVRECGKSKYIGLFDTEAAAMCYRAIYLSKSKINNNGEHNPCWRQHKTLPEKQDSV